MNTVFICFSKAILQNHVSLELSSVKVGIQEDYCTCQVCISINKIFLVNFSIKLERERAFTILINIVYPM